MKILFFFLLTIIALPTWSESTSESSTVHTSQHHSGIQAGGSLNTNSTNDTKIAGANIQADEIEMTADRNMDIETRQDVSSSKSESQSISVGNNMGFSISESSANSNWTNNQTTIKARKKIDLTAGETLTNTGAVIANELADGTDGGNLNVNANKIVARDLHDSDTASSSSISLGISIGSLKKNKTANDPNTISQINLGFGSSEKDKQGDTFATFGNGNLNATIDGDINRDIKNTQIITKDESEEMNINLSIDTKMLTNTSDYASDVWNIRTNATNAGKQTYQAGVDLTDTISSVYDGAVNLSESSDHYNRQLNFSDATQSLSSVDLKALSDGKTSSKSYQNALNNLNENYVAIYGVDPKKAEEIMLADLNQAGFRSTQGEGIFVDSVLGRNASNTVVGHEMTGHQIDAILSKDRGEEGDEAFANSLNNQFGQSLDLANSLRGDVKLSDSANAYLYDTSNDFNLIQTNKARASAIPESQRDGFFTANKRAKSTYAYAKGNITTKEYIAQQKEIANDEFGGGLDGSLVMRKMISEKLDNGEITEKQAALGYANLAVQDMKTNEVVSNPLGIANNVESGLDAYHDTGIYEYGFKPLNKYILDPVFGVIGQGVNAVADGVSGQENYLGNGYDKLAGDTFSPSQRQNFEKNMEGAGFILDSLVVGSIAKNAVGRIIRSSVDDVARNSTDDVMRNSVDDTVRASSTTLGTSTVKEGSFSIIDWSGYPIKNTPKGPFRLLKGEEYIQARKLANKTNRRLHRLKPELKGKQIHEIHPVKFGGDPVLSSNKISLFPKEHIDYNRFWLKLQNNIKKK